MLRRKGSITEILEIQNDSYKKQIDAINEAHDQEIQKRRGKWNLKSLAWMDFDDISQIIKLHIFKSN